MHYIFALFSKIKLISIPCSLILAICCLLQSDAFSQSLNVKETLEYIYSTYKKYGTRSGGYMCPGCPVKNFEIQISDQGYFKALITVDGRPYVNRDITYQVGNFFYYDVFVEVDKNNIIGFKCKNSNSKCINGGKTSQSFYLNVTREGEAKFLNAFLYLFEILYSSPEYNVKEDDPFAQWNYNNSSSGGKSSCSVVIATT